MYLQKKGRHQETVGHAHMQIVAVYVCIVAPRDQVEAMRSDPGSYLIVMETNGDMLRMLQLDNNLSHQVLDYCMIIVTM